MSEFVELYQSGTLKFLNLAGQGRITTYLLKENPTDVPTFYLGCLGIYPRTPLSLKSGFMAFSIEEGRKLDLRKVLSLQVPERIRRIVIEPIPNSDELLAELANARMPSKVLAFGETVANGEEVILLACIPGIKPEDALEEIQERTRAAIAEKN